MQGFFENLLCYQEFLSGFWKLASRYLPSIWAGILRWILGVALSYPQALGRLYGLPAFPDFILGSSMGVDVHLRFVCLLLFLSKLGSCMIIALMASLSQGSCRGGSVGSPTETWSSSYV